jgi:hypothetical protein
LTYQGPPGQQSMTFARREWCRRCTECSG